LLGSSFHMATLIIVEFSGSILLSQRRHSLSLRSEVETSEIIRQMLFTYV